MQKPRKQERVTIRQIGGNDGYQWCVLVDGLIKWSGMQRMEAKWRAMRERTALAAQQKETNDAV